MTRTIATIALSIVCAQSCATVGVPAGSGHPSGGAASSAPPAGLTAEQVPQFVHFGFDDNGVSGRQGSGTVGGLTFVTRLFAGKTNPVGKGNRRTYDGTSARFSFYVVTRYLEQQELDTPEHVKRQWRAAVETGHEIGIHTHSHPHGEPFTAEQWSEEIAICRDWLTRPFDVDRAADRDIGLGMQAADVSGFRAPYLEYGPPLFPALRGAGLSYDCSIE